MCLISTISEDNNFINEYLLIYKDHNSYQNHFNKIKYNINNYLSNIEFINNVAPIVEGSYHEIGTIINLNSPPPSSSIEEYQLIKSNNSYQGNYRSINHNSKTKKIEDEKALKIENQNKIIIDLKNKLKKANETIENQNKIINELKNKLNISNDKINYYKNEINNLENNINKKEKELNDYISYLESELNNINKTTKVDLKDVMCVNFTSMDGNIHKAIPCIPSNTFAEVEEKLYQFFPEYRESNNTFLAHGSTILRFKTISQNKIGDGFHVILNT